MPTRRNDRRIFALIAVLAFLFFALFTRGHFSGSDESGLYQTTRALFEAGTLAVPRIVHTGKGADDRYYSHFSIGQSLLALPLYATGRFASAVLPEGARRALAGPDIREDDVRYGGRVEIFAVGLFAPTVCALLVGLFFLFERQLGASLRTSAVCALLLAFTTYVATLSTFFLRHASEAVTIVGALYCFARWKDSGRAGDLWLGSALASLTILVRLPASVAGPALGGYLAWCVYERSGRRWNREIALSALPAVAVPLLLALAASATGDLLKWGRPWNIHQWRTAQSLGTPMSVSLHGFLFSPGISIFVYSPLLLPALFGFRRFWRHHRAEALTVLALCLTFLVTFGSFTGWTGLWSSPGPRYVFIATPLLMLPLGPWLDASRRAARWLWVAPFAVAGAIVQLALMSVQWPALIHTMGWIDFAPRWGFLFEAEHSPVAGAVRLALSGAHLDPWLLRLARGAEEIPPHPTAALIIFIVWVLLFSSFAIALWRATASAESDRA